MTETCEEWVTVPLANLLARLWGWMIRTCEETCHQGNPQVCSSLCIPSWWAVFDFRPEFLNWTHCNYHLQQLLSIGNQVDCHWCRLNDSKVNVVVWRVVCFQPNLESFTSCTVVWLMWLMMLKLFDNKIEGCWHEVKHTGFRRVIRLNCWTATLIPNSFHVESDKFYPRIVFFVSTQPPFLDCVGFNQTVCLSRVLISYGTDVVAFKVPVTHEKRVGWTQGLPNRVEFPLYTPRPLNAHTLLPNARAIRPVSPPRPKSLVSLPFQQIRRCLDWSNCAFKWLTVSLEY